MVEINPDYLGFTTRDHKGYALVEFATPSLMKPDPQPTPEDHPAGQGADNQAADE